MSERIAGITVKSEGASVVVLTHEEGAFELVEYFKLALQSGARPEAYRILGQQLIARLNAAKLNWISIKATEAGRNLRQAHLDSAETRGVVIAAAAAAGTVRMMKKSSVSKTFGERKVDAYIDDRSFWEEKGLAELPAGMKEAAFTAIALCEKPE